MVLFSGPFDPVLVAAMSAIFGVRGVRTFLAPESMYKEIGLPLEPPKPESSKGTVSPLIYVNALYEIAYGMCLLALKHECQRRALTVLILAGVFMNLGFGIVVWRCSGPKKASSHWLLGVAFLVWYWRCWVSPQGMQNYRITVHSKE
ncbi:DUF4267 domain-containing protein [Aspergillus lucknowensis]|uniref:Uncharacterized protein n=1 Tax=Aspergillus lucknowensis TaxID=176173 RepID=A0ABR4LJV5_9EURO